MIIGRTESWWTEAMHLKEHAMYWIHKHSFSHFTGIEYAILWVLSIDQQDMDWIKVNKSINQVAYKKLYKQGDAP